MDLEAYFQRIGYIGPVEPTVDVLRAVHRAQALSVPYENLDVQLGVRTGIGIEPIYDKIVTRRRGGWCYELNGLLGWALGEIGFDVTRVAGGVMREVRGDSAISNHLVLLVELERTYLADIGLGDGLRDPIPLEPGVYEQDGLRFQLERLDDGHWRFANSGRSFPPNFDFRQAPADEQALADRCLTLQTDPESGFVQNLVCQMMEAEAVTCLTGRVLRRKSGRMETGRLMQSEEELAATLAATFGIRGVDTAALWARAAARHETLFGARPIDEIVVAGM